MRYSAKVLNASAAVEFVDVDANDKDEAKRIIASSGGRVLDLREKRAAWFGSGRQKAFNLPVFNQQLHSLLDAGQPIVDAIDILGRNDKRGRHRAIYDTLLDGLRQGKQLSESMSSIPSVFPPLYVAMVKASETTGTVKASIKRFMQYQQQAAEIRGKLVAAAIYPAILVGVGFIVIAFLMLYVVPRFSLVFDTVSTQKNGSSGFIQSWGKFVQENTLFAWAFLPTLVTAAVLLFTQKRVRTFLFLKLIASPWIGEKVWLLQMARMYRTFSMLLHSGVSVVATLKMTSASLPEAMRDSLIQATQAVSEGRPMSAVMHEFGLSTEISQRLLIAGESSGNLDDMMERIADFYDQEMATWIDTAGRLIEPILMVGIGLVIGAIVLLLYSPIFDLANAV